MSIFSRLFSRRSKGPDQAVIVHLDGRGLPAAIYDQFDLATIEYQLAEAIADAELGEFDGNEVGQGAATLYMDGPDAERLFAGIEPTMRAYPLCKNARCVIRRGPPGSPERIVVLN